MSQDDLAMYFHLHNLVEYFGDFSAVSFFRSDLSRNQGSKARQIVESGSAWLTEMKEEEVAGVLFVAILLGEKTLLQYVRALKDSN